MERRSACSGDCHQCGGCGAARETITVSAENLIGAGIGDDVIVETATGTVLKAAAVVYLLPIALFFAGYFLGEALRFFPGVMGAGCFALGILPAVWMNRKLTRGREKTFRIVAYAQEN